MIIVPEISYCFYCYSIKISWNCTKIIPMHSIWSIFCSNTVDVSWSKARVIWSVQITYAQPWRSGISRCWRRSTRGMWNGSGRRYCPSGMGWWVSWLWLLLFRSTSASCSRIYWIGISGLINPHLIYHPAKSFPCSACSLWRSLKAVDDFRFLFKSYMCIAAP